MGMARILLFSDIHVHPHKRKAERLHDCLKALDWVFSVAVKEQVDAVLFGGDLLHERQKIDSLTYTEVFKILESHSNHKFKTWLLLGNHDMWFSNNWNVNSIYPFGALNNFETVTETKELKICDSVWHFIPYTHNPLEELEKLPRNNVANIYLLGHLSIDGAKLNSAGSIADVSVEHDGDMIKMDRKAFKEYKHSFFGHYHGAQKLSSNMEYIGSPLQLSFGEAGEEKHVIILDTSNNTKVYIKNDFSPKHHYINQSELHKFTKQELERSFVTLIADLDVSSLDKKEIESKIEELGIDTIKIRQKPREINEHVLDDAKAILSDEDKLIERYVQQVNPEGLDRDILVSLGQSITQYEGSNNEKD